MNEVFKDWSISLVLADDHEVVRVGIRRLLSVDKSIRILDEASNGEDALELIKYHKPDIALLDILMPKLDGIEATKIIKQTMPDVFVVIMTAFEDFSHIDKALDAGANGYLTKDIGAKDLIDSLHHVVTGDRVFSKTVIKILQKKYFAPEEANTEPVIISKREQEILNLVVKGKTSPEISDELFISVRTVQSHRANLMQKLGINNAAGLVRYAMMNMITENKDS